MKKSQVYTKAGDQGTTSLIGGTIVPKHHPRLDAYGTVDELNTYIGLVRAWPADQQTNETLIQIQKQLFMIGAYLATDDTVSDLRTKLNCDEEEIKNLENEMDRLENNLPPLKNFVLPGGHQAVAHCHIVRTISRRAERKISKMSEETEVSSWVMRYINRLSDYFFVLARHFSNYFGVDEIPWKAEL